MPPRKQRFLKRVLPETIVGGPFSGWRAQLTVGAPALLIYLGLLIGGADNSLLALLLSGASACLLLIFLMLEPVRAELRRLNGLPAMAAAFALVLLAAVYSVTPWIPGGEHPVWTFVSALGASTVDRAQTLTEIFKLLGLAAIFLTGGMLGRSKELARRAHLTIVGMGALFALWALVRLADPAAALIGRLDGGLPSANVAGTVLASLAILCLPLMGRTRASSARIGKIEQIISSYAPGVSLMMLFVACLVLTASRGAIISAAAGAVVYLAAQTACGRFKIWQGVLVASLIGLLGAGLLLTKGDLAFHRFSISSADPAFSGRLPAFAAHWPAFLRSPLFGYGLGSFGATNKMILTLAGFPALWNLGSLHNVYLQWLEEAGLVGATPMFGCIALVLFSTIAGLFRTRRFQSLISALLAVDAVFLVHGLSDFPVQVFAIAAWWALVLGLQLGMASARG